MPRPLLFCLKSGRSVCYSVPDNTYDKTSDNWMYEGKVIHIFYDAEHNTYCDNGVSNGINIKVIRDKNDNIEKLVETEGQELDQYVK